MLNLAEPTHAGWSARVLADLDEVLLDHAHCEKKAAGTALNLIFRYPQHAWLHRPLAALAREELLHFEQALGRLEARGIAFCAQRPAPYAGRLRAAVRGREAGRLVDTLLCCALIEARSCERLQLLSEAVPDLDLRDFYTGLVASEARHHGVYVMLAERAAGAPVRERLRELALHEASVLRESPALPRLHA